MLEAQPLDGVRQLDVDAEVVGVELELVALEQRALFIDIHQQRGDVAVDRELPVTIFRRIGLEIDAALAVVQFAFCVGHGCPHNVIQRAEVGCFRRPPPVATRAGSASAWARISPSWCWRSSRLTKSETARKVASGASRCGACRVFGNSATSTGQ